MHLDYVGCGSNAGSEFVGPGQAHRVCMSNELPGEGRRVLMCWSGNFAKQGHYVVINNRATENLITS